MPSFLKKKQFWGSIIAVLLLAYCVKDIRGDDINHLYERVNFYYLIPAILSQFVMIIGKGVRWGTIIEKHKKLSFLKLIPLFSAGQVLNIVMPALTGQVGRLLLFARKAELTKTYVFSTIVIEVLFDAISLVFFIFLLSTAAFAFPAEYRQIGFLISIITAAALVLLYLILHFQDQIGVVGRKLLRGRWPGIYISLRKFSRSFTRGIELLRSTQYFARTLVFSLLAWFAHVLVIYFLFRAFGFELPIFAAVVLMVINTVALMVPITPGNAGTFELVIVAPLLAYKVVKSDAVLFALALHIIDLLPIFVLGFMFLHTERMTLKEIKAEGEREELPDDMDDIIVEEKKV